MNRTFARSTFALALVAVTATSAHAQAAATIQAAGRTAQPSTRATVAVSLTAPQGVQGVMPLTIQIDYGQPHLRGRRLHTPDLVPLDSVWRLGANATTMLETETDLVIGGRRLAKGKYALWALPTSAGWKLIVNSNIGAEAGTYAAAQDVARIDLRRRALTSPVESFSMWLVPSRDPGTPAGVLRFAWGDVELSVDWSAPGA
ncbi:MAG: DUF2911 domain-containing protein [Gemmatimonadota bacterium]|nr:DUF2911 domain-containing protein [Gemmatimonadota bacterium]